MHIVADENIPLADAFFSHLGTVERVSGRSLTRKQLLRADLLLVRSVTTVNEALLVNTPVKFVASATIGTDHADLDYLRQNGIRFSNAPGCNADSVVDYVLSALVHLAQQQGCLLSDRRVGIVGVGNVGGRLQQRLRRMGIEPLLCDPPRAEQETDSTGFVDLSELVQRCDLFCLHTPLTHEGSHPSYHLFDAAVLNALPEGSWLINAGRGAVINNAALSSCLLTRPDLQVVLDVWEPEPDINTELAQQVVLATPHIAGYSLEGKSRGTEMIYQRACEFLGVAASRSLNELLPRPSILRLELDSDAAKVTDLIPRLTQLVYDPRRDHNALMLSVRDKRAIIATEFDRLRRQYPDRREFSSLQIMGLAADNPLATQLSAYGFNLRIQDLDGA